MVIKPISCFLFDPMRNFLFFHGNMIYSYRYVKEGSQDQRYMSLFKKKEKATQGRYGEKIVVKNGKDDWRSYPKPGSLFHIEITRDDTTKVQEKDDPIEELQ